MEIDDNFVIQRYGDKNRLASYILRAKKGFFREEEIIIKKYLKSNSKILVVGCGTGREIFGLKKIGFTEITGIDISPDMIREAKKLLPETELLVCDINKFKSGKKYDAVIYFNNILEQIPNSNKRKKAILKSKILLNKRGLIFLTTHSCFVYNKSIFEFFKNFLKQISYEVGLRKNSPFEYINTQEKIYASYSNPFIIKRILKKIFNIKEINSKKFILARKDSNFFYLFDEPIYYIGELK